MRAVLIPCRSSTGDGVFAGVGRVRFSAPSGGARVTIPVLLVMIADDGEAGTVPVELAIQRLVADRRVEVILRLDFEADPTGSRVVQGFDIATFVWPGPFDLLVQSRGEVLWRWPVMVEPERAPWLPPSGEWRPA